MSLLIPALRLVGPALYMVRQVCSCMNGKQIVTTLKQKTCELQASGQLCPCISAHACRGNMAPYFRATHHCRPSSGKLLGARSPESDSWRDWTQQLCLAIVLPASEASIRSFPDGTGAETEGSLIVGAFSLGCQEVALCRSDTSC